jgi:hypothetical protein
VRKAKDKKVSWERGSVFAISGENTEFPIKLTLEERRSFKDLRGLLTMKGRAKKEKSKESQTRPSTKEGNYSPSPEEAIQKIKELEAIIELQQKEIEYLYDALENINPRKSKELTIKTLKSELNLSANLTKEEVESNILNESQKDSKEHRKSNAILQNYLPERSLEEKLNQPSQKTLESSLSSIGNSSFYKQIIEFRHAKKGVIDIFFDTKNLKKGKCFLL